MSPEEFAKAKTQRFPGCMIGEREGVCFGLFSYIRNYSVSENILR